MADITLKDHLAKIQKLGGKAIVKQRGKKYMSELAKRGHAKRKNKIKNKKTHAKRKNKS